MHVEERCGNIEREIYRSEKRSGLVGRIRKDASFENAGRSARACSMLNRKASVIVRPAVAGRELKQGRSSGPSPSRTRFFAKFVEDFGSYRFCRITLGYFGKLSAVDINLC